MTDTCLFLIGYVAPRSLLSPLNRAHASRFRTNQPSVRTARSSPTLSPMLTTNITNPLQGSSHSPNLAVHGPTLVGCGALSGERDYPSTYWSSCGSSQGQGLFDGAETGGISIRKAITPGVEGLSRVCHRAHGSHGKAEGVEF